eukprot:IDg17696t1
MLCDWIRFQDLAAPDSNKKLTFGQQDFTVLTNIQGNAGQRLGIFPAWPTRMETYPNLWEYRILQHYNNQASIAEKTDRISIRRVSSTMVAGALSAQEVLSTVPRLPRTSMET